MYMTFIQLCTCAYSYINNTWLVFIYHLHPNKLRHLLQYTLWDGSDFGTVVQVWNNLSKHETIQNQMEKTFNHKAGYQMTSLDIVQLTTDKCIRCIHQTLWENLANQTNYCSWLNKILVNVRKTAWPLIINNLKDSMYCTVLEVFHNLRYYHTLPCCSWTHWSVVRSPFCWWSSRQIWELECLQQSLCLHDRKYFHTSLANILTSKEGLF